MLGPPAASAVVVMTTPRELPDTLEIANRRLRTETASRPCFSALSNNCPMTLAVKKPARLAPPAAAMMIGRGQLAGVASQPLARIHKCTASSNFSRAGTTAPASVSMVRTS